MHTEPVTVPREVEVLTNALSRVHGGCVVRKEKNGYHIYMASPECLKLHGRGELNKKHLAVNASKYLAIGKWKGARHSIDLDSTSAMCMKTGKTYKITHLLSMPSIQERMPGEDVQSVTIAHVNEAWLVEDEHGNKIPEVPGITTLLTDLPEDHTARLYLRDRGYDEELLVRKFNCSYCYKETPEDPVRGRWYRRMPGGFKDTAQGRIIFYAYVAGVRVAWQGRIIDSVDGDVRSYWHPYDEKWVEVENKVDGKWETNPVFSDSKWFHWNPSKYRTSSGASRNSLLMGLDYVVQWNKERTRKVVMLTEGPLDAARFPNGVACLGKHLSEQQASMLAVRFNRVVVVPDNDKAGLEMLDSARKALIGKCEITSANIPPDKKDAGDLSQEDAYLMMIKYL